jgi:hypothetical protein
MPAPRQKHPLSGFEAARLEPWKQQGIMNLAVIEMNMAAMPQPRQSGRFRLAGKE